MNSLIGGLTVLQKYQDNSYFECIDNLISCKIKNTVTVNEVDRLKLIALGWFENGTMWSFADSILNRTELTESTCTAITEGEGLYVFPKDDESVPF